MACLPLAILFVVLSRGLGVRDGRDAAEAIDKWIIADANAPRAAGVGL